MILTPLYYDVKFDGSHYVMHFLVLISYRYINYMCAFKLPVDQEYAIRQSFAAFLLLTPLFFSEFLGSNDKGNGGEWWPGFKIGGRESVAPLFFFLQGLRCKFEEKKLHLSPVAPIGRPGYIFEIFQNRHIFF